MTTSTAGILTGTWTLQLVDKNVPSYPPYHLEFSPDHILRCPQLGVEGRYYCEGNLILMAFGNPGGNFIFPTDYMFCGHRTAQGDFEGVMGENTNSGWGGWTMSAGQVAPPASSNFGDSISLDEVTFYGMERPNNVETVYKFDQEHSIGIVKYGTRKQGPTIAGKYRTLRYSVGGEQLLVFSSDRLITYGALVEDIAGNIKLKNGLYMNPFAGNGAYGTWEA